MVGLLDAGEVVRSNAPILEFKGEVKDSFLALTGDDVLDTASGGGEENLRHRRGVLLSTKCSPLLFWLVAKNNSNDLKIRAKAMNRLQTSENYPPDAIQEHAPYIKGHNIIALLLLDILQFSASCIPHTWPKEHRHLWGQVKFLATKLWSKDQ